LAETLFNEEQLKLINFDKFLFSIKN